MEWKIVRHVRSKFTATRDGRVSPYHLVTILERVRFETSYHGKLKSPPSISLYSTGGVLFYLALRHCPLKLV